MKWYTTTKPERDNQGLVIEETTGKTIAVTYDPKDAALVAAAPALFEVVSRLFMDINGYNATMRATNPKYAASPMCDKLTELMRDAGSAYREAKGNE